MAHPPPKPWYVLALVSLPIFIGALDLTIISAVLPAVIADLKVPIQEGLDVATWVISGYLLAYAISMTFMGRVSDIWGRRFVYLICLVIFLIGSWLVAASSEGSLVLGSGKIVRIPVWIQGWPAHLAYKIARMIQGDLANKSLSGLYAMIFGRVIQAFGAGAMVPVSMALVADMFPPEKRALPLGVVGAVDTAGWVLGHLYGGIMVQFFNWPWLFWFNLPVVVLMFLLTWWALRGLEHVRAAETVDWTGAILISIALLGLNISLGSSAPETVEIVPVKHYERQIAAGVAVIAFVIFLIVERRKREPLLNLKIFSNRNLSSASAINLLVGFCLYVGLVSVPLFINVVGSKDLNQGALVTGFLLCMFTVPLAFASIPGAWLTDRLGYRKSTAIGLLLALAGFGLMMTWKKDMAPQAVDFTDVMVENLKHLFRGQFDQFAAPGSESISGVSHMIVGLLCAGVGLGLTISPVGTAVINAAGDAERGMASALVIILRLIGMTVSASTMTTYGLYRYTKLGRDMLPPEKAFDLEETARVALEVVTIVTAEMALIALILCVAALIPALILRRRDLSGPS